MSAGICVMNRNAIAMAADSAVTVGDHVAIHNSANKLFSLSRVAPIGVIIYANSTFMSVPMEIIIKEYKKHIGTTAFDKLSDYLEDFISYLETNAELFRFKINEGKFIDNVFKEFIGGLLGDFSVTCDRRKDKKGSELTETEIKEVAAEVVDATKKFVDGLKKVPLNPFSNYVRKNYRNTFLDYIKKSKTFDWLTSSQAESMADKACDIFDTTYERKTYVGVAIAGYGNKEIYPTLKHLHLSGFIDGRIKYQIEKESEISEKMPSAIQPLAQDDVMQTFLFGINDQFLDYLAREIPNQIAESVSKMNDNLFATGKKREVLKELSGVTGNILQHVQETAAKNFMMPIFGAVASLPIEELALLAESMINITSIRRKVALDDNSGTVGGPIDVAIISKGDGFVWIKRKHYFDRKYNPQFFYSHYRNVAEENDDET